jgi:hypothetical protein
MRSETAQCLLPVFTSFAAGAAELVAAHSIVHIATFDVLARVATEGRMHGLVPAAPSRNWQQEMSLLFVAKHNLPLLNTGHLSAQISSGQERQVMCSNSIRQLEVGGHWDVGQERASVPRAQAEDARSLFRNVSSIKALLCEGVSNMM